jgi:hypothetical protein
MPNALASAVPERVAVRSATAAVRSATVALAGMVDMDGEVPDSESRRRRQ